MPTSFPSLRLAQEAVAFNFQLENFNRLQGTETPLDTIQSILKIAKRSLQVIDKEILKYSRILTFKPCHPEDRGPLVLIIEVSDKEYIVLIVGVGAGVVQITPHAISKHLPANLN